MEYFGDRAVAKWLHSPLPGELDLKTKIFHQKILNSDLSYFGT